MLVPKRPATESSRRETSQGIQNISPAKNSLT